ncbi:MAG: helix-turn-helix domain-containing protein [Cyclobacteriaceae bacterium]|nr:helix-turn-helix domain-containing protein [Cyclobacteriaceae bacterium]
MGANERINPFELIEAKLETILVELQDLRHTIHKAESTADKGYYSILEAAEKLKVAEITLYRNIKAGKIPFKRIGSRIMIPGSFFES